MDIPTLTMISLDDELNSIPMPPRGVDYERVPSPPPSEHSSEADDEMAPTDKPNPKKKMLKTRAEYLELRNKSVEAYLKKFNEHPLSDWDVWMAIVRKKIEKEAKLLEGKNYVAKPEVRKAVYDEVCYSGSSQETDCSIPRDMTRELRRDFQEKCYAATVDHRKRQQLFGDPQNNGAQGISVIFSHVNFQMILEAKWKLIEMKRLETIFEGKPLNCKADPKCPTAGDEIQKIYGPMDTESEHFKKLMEAFEEQFIELNCLMREKENKLMGRIVEQKIMLTDFPELLAALRLARSRLETRIAKMSELHCDQNPYTNENNMDYWVMPRPKQTIEVYDVRNKETEDFLEFNLPVDKIGRPQLELEDKYKLFVREGYNTAVFDVGWHYSPERVYGDVKWKGFFIHEAGYSSRSQRKNFTEEGWRNHLLQLRGDLMSFNPFGVESTRFYHYVRIKYRIKKEDSIFGNVYDHVGVNYLSDVFFAQTLLTGGTGSTNKIILFDSLLEGVIVTPAEMLLRVWTRIRFLIEERPDHLLPLHTLQNIYECSFKQMLFPLQWGFKDVEEFVKYSLLDLPTEVTQNVIIVEKNEKELREMEARRKSEAEARKIIDAKWAKVLENDDDDEEDDDQMKFDEDDLFKELIYEGPWVSEGEVYRVLDD